MSSDYEKDLNDLGQEMLKTLLRMIDDRRIVRSCINCRWFNSQQEICTTHNNLRPPAHIIAKGCDQHSCEIPF